LVLYDHRGEPVRTADLKVERGGSTITGIRSPYRDSQASSINPRRLGTLLSNADNGDTDAYFTLAQEIEERYPHYDAVLRGRKQAVSGSEIAVCASTDKRRDQKVADAVRALIGQPQFETLVFDLLDGLGKGISFVEIGWKTDANTWTPATYSWREQRHFAWDPETLSVPLLRTDAHPNGEPLAPYKWAVHAPQLRSGPSRRGGLARSAVTLWMLQSFSIRDLMAFLEQYGMPIRVGTYDDNATPEQQAVLATAITNMGTDAGCTIPKSMAITLVERKGGAGANDSFLPFVNWLNSECSKLVLGQTMTTENGASMSQAEVHERKELTLTRADARAVCATIERDIITPFVRLNYGPDVEVPSLEYVIRTPAEQTAYMTNVKAFVELGGEVEQSVVRDRLGLPDPPTPKGDELPPKLLRAKAASAPADSPPVEAPK
jgi:phage gp29-like protein